MVIPIKITVLQQAHNSHDAFNQSANEAKNVRTLAVTINKYFS